MAILLTLIVHRPLVWHTLVANNSMCNTGTSQSPINLNSSIPRSAANELKFAIPDQAEVEFENLGTTVEVM